MNRDLITPLKVIFQSQTIKNKKVKLSLFNKNLQKFKAKSQLNHLIEQFGNLLKYPLKL